MQGIRISLLLSALILGPALQTASALERTVRISLLEDARSPDRTAWRFTTQGPGVPEWTEPGFDDSQWPLGNGGFGTGVVAGAHILTEWSTEEIWLRKTFDLAGVRPEDLILSHHHDEDASFFINGVLVHQETGWLSAYGETYLPEDWKAALKPEGNVLAVHCRNANAPGYIDAGLSYTVTLNTESLVADARTFPEEWRFTADDPGFEWQKPEYEDMGWTAAPAGFGAGETHAANTATEWLSGDIWMRKVFQADRTFPWYLLSFHHDDAMEVYINGNLVLEDPVYTQGYQERVLAAAALAVKPGANLIAIHCHNNDGPQYVDMGLQGLENPVPTAARDGVRRGADKAARKGLRTHAGGVGTLLAADGDRLVLGSLSHLAGGRLEVFGSQGRRLAILPVGRGENSLSLPASLGTGVFRYRWDSPSGMLQGTLVRLP